MNIMNWMQNIYPSFINKRPYFYQQELEFVAGLIRVGAFQQNEVMGVLQVLFPTKSDKQLKDIMSKICDPKQEPSKNIEEE